MRRESSWLTRMSPYMLSVMRLVIAAVFMEHGTQKLFGFPGGSLGMALPPLLMASGIIEAVGGGLLLLGLLTRLAAFILAGEMAVAYFMQHAPHGLYPLVNKGELAVVYCFIFLYLFFAGGGPLSLDALIFRRKPPTP